MSIKKNLQRSLYQVLQTNHAGSFATRYDRQAILMRFAAELVDLGYKVKRIQNLQSKHISAMVKHWQDQKLNNGTIKNRLAAVRHLGLLMNKTAIVPSNAALNVGKRQYQVTFNRAIVNPDFSKISDPYIKASLDLIRVFGLRREEALKIKPHMADRGDRLELLPSWCKGNRARVIPITSDEQRHCLEQAKRIAGQFGNSLIPVGKNYIQQRWCYDKQVQAAGISNPHGLRHAYAQRRYKELTGWDPPINGGPSTKQLSANQKAIDHQARMILTEELGHSRKQIVKNYIG